MSEGTLRLFSIIKSEKSKMCSPLPTSHKASPPIPERLKPHLLSFAPSQSVKVKARLFCVTGNFLQQLLTIRKEHGGAKNRTRAV